MDGPTYALVIGDKTYSSWSLRPWLAMTHTGLPFEEERVILRQPDSKAAILRRSPSGKVPALKTVSMVIWDSLAILEFLAERHPGLGLWPGDGAVRAEARAVSAEMHSGFQALRNEMPMDLMNRFPTPPMNETLEHNIRRVVAIWSGARSRFAKHGPFLFGGFSIADAMFAPVATRFETYGVDLAAFGDDGRAAEYGSFLLTIAAMKTWKAGAATEMAERAGVRRA